MSWDSLESALKRLQQTEHTYQNNYLGFYSSWLGGYFREPWAMLLPMDDHGFHRGDGVFEAVRIHERAYIDLQAHLRRLQNSARAIQMELPKSLGEIESICVELARRCDSATGILRLYVTRGPGGFSPSPTEVVGHQIYAAITRLAPPSPEKYAHGVRAMMSSVPAKDAMWSQIKSCNYLQNVLMKMECIDKGYDFAISLDKDGRLCEGSTENLLIVNRDGEVLVPRFDYTLRGTTVSVVLAMAGGRTTDLTLEDLRHAREAAFVGTTLGVLPITSIDGQPIGDGRAGARVSELNRQLLDRWATDPTLRTRF